MRLRSTAIRVVAAIVLVTLAWVPTIARAHDRLDQQRTPAQEHSRFRWSNSCASVPEKHTPAIVVAPADGPAHTIVDFPPRVSTVAATRDVRLPASLRPRSPHGLRAPPSALR